MQGSEKYTGHCWRRTTATMAAEYVMSLPQIKQITGHKSYTVVQGYIDSSIQTKTSAASTLSLLQNNNDNANKKMKVMEPPGVKSCRFTTPEKNTNDFNSLYERFGNVVYNINLTMSNQSSLNAPLFQTSSDGKFAVGVGSNSRGEQNIGTTTSDE